MEFLKNYGTLLIAIYAVVQVWIIALWKKFLLTGTVSIYKTVLLEIGYSNFGPTIGLNGTLRSQQKDVFVSEIRLIVTRKRDNSTLDLEWTAFRSPKLHVSQTDPFTLEIPSGFNINLTQPYRFNIIFSDKKIQADIAPYLTDLLNDWREHITKKQDEIIKAVSERGIDHDVVVETLFKEYTQSGAKWIRAWDLLNSENLLGGR